MISFSLLLVLRAPFVCFFLFIYFLVGLLNKILFFYSEYIRKCVAQKNTQFISKVLIKLFNFKVTYKTHSTSKGVFLICNHLSYMDIPVIASKIPTLFITSLEMKRTPFLGWLTNLGECLYVDRKSHKNINTEISDIQTKLNSGFNVLVFPEATTSNGIELKPFRSSLLKVADQSQMPLLSYCLTYTKLNGKKTDNFDLKKLAWSEEKSFLPHVVMLLGQKSVHVQLTEVEKIQPQAFSDRKDLTKHLQTSISNVYYGKV